MKFFGAGFFEAQPAASSNRVAAPMTSRREAGRNRFIVSLREMVATCDTMEIEQVAAVTLLEVGRLEISGRMEAQFIRVYLQE